MKHNSCNACTWACSAPCCSLLQHHVCKLLPVSLLMLERSSVVCNAASPKQTLCAMLTKLRLCATFAAQPAPEWRQQDSLLAKASVGFGQPHINNVAQHTDSALPQSASLRLVQAPAAFNRPIVQRKLFKPPFVVRLQCSPSSPALPSVLCHFP